MAVRPVFKPSMLKGRLVEEVSVSFEWHKGMAPSQKKKNINELHFAASKLGILPVLEVSTKSDVKLGQRLSAFNLKVEINSGTAIPLESAFQGSKVFERGGPYTDIYKMEGREARRDPRLLDSGALLGFNFNEMKFPLEPKTIFYDWLYIRALYIHRDFLVRLHDYMGFTDIEFNPNKSINCQARSCATFVSLDKLGLLSKCVESPDFLLKILHPDSIEQPHSYKDRQQTLL